MNVAEHASGGAYAAPFPKKYQRMGIPGMSINLGSVIRNKRKARGLSIREAAERAGISGSFLSKVEHNINSPSIVTLMNICGVIGTSAGDLLMDAAAPGRAVADDRTALSGDEASAHSTGA
jgi:transcriptional regulator with XRE-family HTH domain